MSTAEREQLEEKLLANLINTAQEAIEQADEMICDKLNSSEHASAEFKQAQRVGNHLMKIKNLIGAVKYEL